MLRALLQRTARRLRTIASLEAAAVGFAAWAAVVAASVLVRQPRAGFVAGALLAIGLAAFSLRRASGRWRPEAVAALVERRAGTADNLIVTATSLALGASSATDRMRREVERQADDRAAVLDPASLVPIGRALLIAGAAALGALSLAVATSGVADRAATVERSTPAAALGTVRATVIQPDYLERPPATVEDPEQVSVVVGGRVRLEVQATTPGVWVEQPDLPRVSLAGDSGGTFSTELTPKMSGALVVSAGSPDGSIAATRVLQVLVVPDEAPRVALTQPGRDLAFTTPDATVEVGIEAADAEGLRGLRLAWVRMSGSGESFAFEEGEVLVVVERPTATAWRGRARLPLAAMKIEDGDSLVYRALVRDSNPVADWVASDAFTVDVGKRLEFAGAGFAVPEEDRRYAISQQMVIVKTERLLAARSGLDETAWLEQNRGLAVEQRMVRSEVVFLSGGEVQDEVEEAEHSHELQEGRLENSGRAEMLRAINEMSRAEAALNAGEARQALGFERNALAALQRAFDRRRYFLRTLAERSRIDPSRRLTGDRSRAASRGREGEPRNGDPVAAERALAEALADIAGGGGDPGPGLLARLASIDPEDGAWRALSARLASATNRDDRQEAARAGMAALAARARQRLGASAPTFETNELRGWWRRERLDRRPQ